MDILFLLIPLSVVLVLLVAGTLWNAVRSGQFDDLEGPGFTILLDDDTPCEQPTEQKDAFDLDQTGPGASK